MVMPGDAREWNRVKASGVSKTWSLCWHNNSSMCAMRTTSVSVGQSMNAHGSSGFPGDPMLALVLGPGGVAVGTDVTGADGEPACTEPAEDEDDGTPPRWVVMVVKASAVVCGEGGGVGRSHRCAHVLVGGG